MKKILQLILVAIINLATVGFVSSQEMNDPYILQPEQPEADDFFGAAVAVHGDLAIVGAYQDDLAATDNGAAYIFQRQEDGSWVESSALLPDVDTDDFGASVALEDSIAVVGAGSDDRSGVNAGAVFVYELQSDGSWTEAEELIPTSEVGAYSFFGRSVDISGDMIFVGANGAGAVYVFERQNDGSWTETDLLVASDASNGANFGWSVSVDGDSAIIGAYRDSDGASNAGAAYVFYHQGDGSWSEMTKLQASDLAANSNFGDAVTIHGDIAVVGSPDYDGSDTNTGAAYVYQNQTGTWTELTKLTEPTEILRGKYGASVALEENRILIGASGSGKAYFYMVQEDTTSLLYTIVADNASASADFGASVALGGPTGIVGDFRAGIGGEAYVYTLSKQFISYNSPGVLVAGDGSFDLEARANSGLDLTYSSSDPTIATVSAAGVIEPLNAGVTDITINQAGDDFYETTEEVISLTVKAPFTGSTITEDQSLGTTSNIVEDGAEFGGSIDVSGDFAIIGARYQGRLGDYITTDAGMAYIYQRQADTTWALDFRLWPEERDFSDAIGFAVAIDGETAAVSAIGDDDGANGAGAVYIYERQLDGVWILKDKVIADDAANDFFFGRSIDLQNDRLVVSSAHHNGVAENTGKVYVFEKQSDESWDQVDSFTASDASSYDYFGWSVALYGDRILAGTIRDDDLGNSTGSVYVFERQGDGSWTESGKILPENAGEEDLFGNSVDLEGDIALVGAHKNDFVGQNAGAAFVFERQDDGDWLQTGVLTPSEATVSGEFGSSVDLSNGMAIVGAPSSGTGEAYVYEKQEDGTWTQSIRLEGSNSMDDDGFGSAVALTNGGAMVGAPLQDSIGTDAGIVHVYDIGAPTNLLEQTITVRLPTAVYDTDQPFLLDAETNSGLPLMYSIDDESIATIDADGKLMPAMVGTTSLTISQGGNENYAAANPVTFDLAISKGTPLATQVDKLADLEGSQGDRFGWSVDISGDWAIVGATDANDEAQGGSIYFYNRQSDGSWTLSQQIMNGASSFGVDVAIDGNWAVSGATGSILVFQLQDDDIWQEVNEFTGTGEFGYSVDLDGQRLVASSPFEDEVRGKVFVYDLQEGSWSQSAVIDNPGSEQDFGRAVDLDNNRVLIAANQGSSSSQDPVVGTAYIFELQDDDTWGQIATFDGPGSAAYFGYAVALSGNTAVVGAHKEGFSLLSNPFGAAYIYERQDDGSWSLSQKLQAPIENRSSFFGRSVAIQGTLIMVGDPNYTDVTGEVIGAGYAFEKQNSGTWEPVKQLRPNDPIGSSYFGHSIAFSENSAIVGAPQGEVLNANGPGTVYVFEISDGLLSQIIDFPPLDPVEVNAEPFALNATTSSGLSLSYASSDPSVATISDDGVVTVLAEGETDITVSQPGNETYESAEPVTRTLTVTAEKTAQTITFDAIPDQSLSSGSLTLEATASSGLPVEFEVLSGPATLSGNVLTFTGTGEVVIEATQSGDDSYSMADPVQQRFNIIDQVTSVELDDHTGRLYPVPFDNYFHVESGKKNHIDIKIYDINGKRMPVEIMEQDDLYKVNTQRLEPGLYLVRINERLYKVVKK